MKHGLHVIAALLLTAGLAGAQSKFTIVTGTEIPIGLGDLGEVKCHGAVPTPNPFAPCPAGISGTVRGQQRIFLEDTSDPRTTGVNHGTFNANIHADGTMSAWGTFRLELPDGSVWEGVWEGKLAKDGIFSYSAVAHGSGGSVEGLQLLWDGVFSPTSPTGTSKARILSPGK